VVDQVPPEAPPLPPDPQAPAAKEIKPLLSVCKHLVPEPARLETVNALEVRLAKVADPARRILAKRFVVEAFPETYKLVVVALVVVAFSVVRLEIVDEALTTAPAT
jgi:hypothetical protein